jgi:hypothetical protein
MDYETAANEITDWAPWLVPGLLQTPDYAREWLTALYNWPLATLEARLTARLRRQQTLWRPDVSYTAFIGEPALLATVGSVQARRGQLAALVDAASRSNMTIRVVPSNAGPHLGQLVPFIAFAFPAAPSVVHVELLESGIFHDEPLLTDPFTRTLSRLDEVALTATESVRLIQQISATLE